MTLLSSGLTKRWCWKRMGILAGILCLLLIGVRGYQVYQTRNVPAPLASSIELYTFHDGKLVAYSARDGSVRWTHALEDSYTGKLDMQTGGHIIYLSGQTSTVNIVAAYRADTGTLLWRTPLVPFTSGLLTDQPPLVADGMVYIGIYGQGHHTNGLLYALRGNSGQIAWKHLVPSYPTSILPKNPLTVGDGLVVALTEDHGIFAWHAQDGSLAWHSSLYGYQPVCAQQACYLLQGAITVLALRESSGQLLWQRTIPLQGNAGGSGDILAVFGQRLYLGVVTHWLDAMSTLDGALLWQHEVGLGGGETPLEANGVVYTPDFLSIDALNAHDGARLWSRDADPDSIFGTPLFVHNVLFVAEQSVPPHFLQGGDGSSALFALNAGDGSVYWRFPGVWGVMAIMDTAA